MADAGGLQLLPETRKKIEIHTPGQNKYLVLSFVFMLVVLAVYFGLSVYENSLVSSSADIDVQLASIDKSRDKAEEAKLLNLNQQLSITLPLLNSHLIWSDAFARIQRLTLPQVQYQFFSTNTDNKKFIFEAFAPNYTTVAKQIASFYSDDSFTDVSLDKVSSLPTGRVRFSMQLFFDRTKFLLKSVSKK